MAYEDRDNIIFKGLKYHYIDNLSQVEIAAKLNISRVAVSRYMSRAKREGLVEHKINYPKNFTFKRNEELEKKFIEQYGLKECIIVSSSDIITETLLELSNQLEKLFEKITHDHIFIGVGWGVTLDNIVEIMFSDFVAVCFDGVLNQISKIRFMSGGQFSNLNFVLILPGGVGNGTGQHHSQCLESIFMSIPGLDIAVPSNAYDAKGLLKTSINRGNPVVFFEHKKLYKTEGNIPEKEYSIPFGKGVIVRDGKDLTIVATSYMVEIAGEVADEMKRNSGVEIEIIDPRTLVPLDIEIIGDSVRKTSKLLVLEEGNGRGGVAAEIGYRVNEEYLDYLDYPIKRIGSKNSSIPMTPNLEKAIIPNKDSVINEMEKYFEI